MAELVHAAIDVPAAIAGAARPDCGAIATFLGTTRDHHGGRRVVRLAYEAYEAMALAELERLEVESCKRFEIAACTIVHRLGVVPVAEPSVLVVVTAPHRAAAFDACRWAMDELKRAAPIWKQEQFADGGSEWVQGTRLE